MCRSASAFAERATSTGSADFLSAQNPAPALRARTSSWSMAAGRCRSHAATRGRRPLLADAQRASFATVVVLPLPCSPATSHTAGTRPPMSGGSADPPRRATSSSWTIPTICCPGVRLFSTRSPADFSETRSTNCLTTLKFTSASSRALRISRMASCRSAGDTTPLPRRRFRASASLPVSFSNKLFLQRMWQPV